MLDTISVKDSEIVREYLSEIFEHSSLMVNYLEDFKNFNVQILLPRDFSLVLSSQLQQGGIVAPAETSLWLKLRLKKKFGGSNNFLLFSEDVEFNKNDYSKSQFRSSIETIEAPNSTILIVKKSLDMGIPAEFDLLTKASNNFFSIIGVSDTLHLEEKVAKSLAEKIKRGFIELYISCFDRESYLIITRKA
jgi:hypothetical protein